MRNNGRHDKEDTKVKVHSNSKLYRYFIYLIVITAIVTGISMAKYQSVYTPSGKAVIANWAIKVNTEDITADGTTAAKDITLVPETSANVAEGKLAPGYGGYFDITIDPTGTEVGFDYDIELDVSKLPTDITITEYDLMKATETTADLAITNNKIEGEFTLAENESFNADDVTTFRIYWMWNDVRANDATHTATAIGNGDYSVGVELCVTQKVV